MKKTLLLIVLLVFLALKSFSQTISVGDYAESIARMNQILGVSNDISSFTQHPLNSAFNSKGDSVFQNMVAGKNLIPKFNIFGIPSSVKVLPFTWLNDYNSKLPFGYNDGPLYPNVGYQTKISGGFYIKAGFLNFQFKPEFVHAENNPFSTFADVQANTNKANLISAYFVVINGIDAPERFGSSGLNYIGLGQSKITAIYKNIELGVSTENLWWGPGQQNSIMMSNSAPGFLHWTINSANPLRTNIGSFEWQIIGGRLEQSGYRPYDPGKLVYADPNSYVQKPVVTRYLSAFTVNWQPKWIEGFFIGISGYNYQDIDSSFDKKSFLKRTFAVFKPSASANSTSLGDGQDFAYAINIRQLYPEYHAEIYAEYARNDNAGNITDFILEPEHSTAFTLGASRYFILAEKQYLKLTTELTHLQNPDTFLLRDEPTWYVHSGLPPADGYTNKGRYVGAGIGPGSNSLIFDISYVRNVNTFGLKIERLVHNNDLYYMAFAGVHNYYLDHWVDLSRTFYANIKLKKILISAEFTPIYTYNYEYLQGNDVKNKHGRVVLTYFFD